MERRKLERYAQWLAEAPLNLVAKGDRSDVWGRHIAESLAVVDALAPVDGAAWLDLGTGGGLPGVVMAVVRPDVQVTLVDARGKKVRAVREIVTELGLDNVTALQGRAEALAHRSEHRERYDGVVSRAIGRLDVAAELSRGFVRQDGVVVVVRGADAVAEMARIEGLLGSLGLEAPVCLGIADSPRATNLVTMRAVGSAPSWVPRGDGTPQASPLGGVPSEG